jgi:hypothetical protein
MPAGYMIRMITPPIRNEGSTQELFEVAMEDEDQAKSIVRKASQAATDAIVEIADELSATQIAQLELQPGQVRRAP